MNLEEFESNYRDKLEQSLNDLQTVVLLAANLENRISAIGQNLQNLNQVVEEFIAQQKAQ